MLHNTNTFIQEINPFDIQWLSKNFGLNLSDVKKAAFDDIIGLMYQIHFNDIESAKKFHKTMSETNCRPDLLDFNNSVQLNKHSRKKIINAANQHKNDAAQNNSDSITIENPIIKKAFPIDNQKHIGLNFFENTPPICRMQLENNVDAKIANIIPIPFNLDWLSQYLGLNKNYVKKSKFDFDFLRYEITFDTLEHAENFYTILEKAGASLQIWKFNNTLEMPYSSDFNILRSVGQSNNKLNPWNIDFFVNYFSLNKEQIKEGSNHFCGFTIEFHQPHDAYNYYKKLLENDIYPKKPRSDGKLNISNLNGEILLKKAAELVKNQPNATSQFRL